MPKHDLFDKPFDESTIAKLDIFEAYAAAWIPTFVMQGVREIHIFDFFAGAGYDKKKVAGSPIRILKTINSHFQNIHQKGTRLVVHLNEYDKHKFNLLRKACDTYLKDHKDIDNVVRLKLYNKDFVELFEELVPTIRIFPSLVYFDQNGVKFATPTYFRELGKHSKTDFLYFISSSYFWRFGEGEELSNYLSLDIDKAKRDPYTFIHKHVIQTLRDKLPEDTKLKLYPFTIKKVNRIYGIVFGASHPRAVDKFLAIAWDKNKLNGEANFDINNEAQLDLFKNKISKIQAFQDSIEKLVLSKELNTNHDVYNYSLDCGHIGSHAAERLKDMKRMKRIYYDSRSPLVTYENVYKIKKLIKYEIINHGQK